MTGRSPASTAIVSPVTIGAELASGDSAMASNTARTGPVVPYRRGESGGVHVYDTAAMDWLDTGKRGVVQKAVRRDDERGQFLGMIAMEPMTRSGLHQHQGVATSFFVEGALTDYQGPIGLHQVGINLKGATHDAIAYSRTVFVARLEAPVIYPPEDGPLHGLHAGARHGALSNPAPAVPPDINVTLDAQPLQATGCPGVMRQTAFDYAPTVDDHRMVQLSIAPQSRLPRLFLTGHTEFWVRGGLLEVNGRLACAGCFVIVEPQTELSLACPFGALLLAWAEGPAHWVDPPGPGREERVVRADLFGFR